MKAEVTIGTEVCRLEGGEDNKHSGMRVQGRWSMKNRSSTGVEEREQKTQMNKKGVPMLGQLVPPAATSDCEYLYYVYQGECTLFL